MSYTTFCQDQASDCARRARLTRSAHIAAYYRDLGWRWLRLAEQAQKTGGALGSADQEAEPLSPPRLHSELPIARAQVSQSEESPFLFRFRANWITRHFKKTAKETGLVFRHRTPASEVARLTASLRSIAAPGSSPEGDS